MDTRNRATMNTNPFTVCYIFMPDFFRRLPLDYLSLFRVILIDLSWPSSRLSIDSDTLHCLDICSADNEPDQPTAECNVSIKASFHPWLCKHGCNVLVALRLLKYGWPARSLNRSLTRKSAVRHAYQLLWLEPPASKPGTMINRVFYHPDRLFRHSLLPGCH